MNRVLLDPMQVSDFEGYLASAIPQYAREVQRASDITWEDAQKIAQKSFQDLLPDGLNSKSQFLFRITDASSGKAVGTLWFCIRGEGASAKAFVCDIILNDEERGKGYGRAAMQRLEQEVKKHGLSKIGLHVFGHNHTARALYESLGYQVTNVLMQKNVAAI